MDSIAADIAARTAEGHAAFSMRGTDDRWILIQTNTFTNWVNEQLKPLDVQVSQDLHTEFTDGIKLCQLMEVLQNKRIGRWMKKPMNQHHYLENVTMALNAMKKDDIKLVNIGSEDIVRGNTKLILGMIWRLILRYQIGKAGKVPPKRLMLWWINAVIPELGINNFSTDWNDGIALSALIEYCKPGLFPNWRQLRRFEGVENCRNAMQAAKDNFDIPLIVSPENLASPDLDELSGMTYLSYFMKVDSPGYFATLGWTKQMIPHKNVNNFQTDWNDGTCLAELATACGATVPGWPSPLSSSPPEVIVQKSIDASRTLGIEPVISAKEIADPEVDHLGVMAYAAWFQRNGPKMLQPRVIEEPPVVVAAPVRPPSPPRAVLPLESQLSVRTHQTETYPNNIMTFDVECMEDGIDKTRVTVEVIGPNSKPPVTLSWHGMTAHGDFTPHEPGQHQLLVYNDGRLVQDCPKIIRVKGDATSVQLLSSFDKKIYLNQMVPIQISARDAASGAVRVEARSPSGRVMDMGVGEVNGVFTANFTPTEVGDWSVSIFYESQHIQGSPFNVRVYDAAQVKVFGLEGGSVGKQFSFSIDTSQAGDGDLTIDINHNGRNVPGSLHAEGHGIYRASFMPSGHGIYTIRVFFAGMEVQGSPYTLEIVDSSSVTASGEGLHAVEVNKRASFVVNAHGASGGDIRCQVQSPRGAQVPAQVYNQNDGTFRVEYDVREVGEYVIDVFYYGKPIQGSPFKVNAFDWNRITVHNLKSSGIAGKLVEFDIDAAQAGSGNLEIMVNDGTIPCSVQNRGNRQFHASFMPKDAMPHLVQMKFNGREVPGSPWRVDIRTAAHVTATGQGLQLIAVRHPAIFEVRAGPGAASDAVVQCNVTSPTQRMVPCQVINQYNGVYRVEYVPQEVGNHLVDVQYEGMAVGSSPYTAKSYDPAAIRVSGVGSGMIGKPVEFEIDVTAAGEGQLEIMVNRGSVPNTVKMSRKGVFLVSFIPRDARTHIIDIKFNGELLPRCPIQVPILDTSRVTVQGEGIRQVAVNRSSYFRVNTQSAGVADLQVRVTSPTGKLIPANLEGNSQAGYQVDYDSREVGIHRIDVDYAGQPVPGSPFFAKSYDSSKVIVRGTNDGVVGRRSSFTVDVNDAGEGNMEISITGGGRNIQNHVRQIGPGQFEVSYTPMDEGPHTASVTFNGEHVGGGPFIFRVLDASKVTASGDGLSLVRVGTPSRFMINAPNAHVNDFEVKIYGPSGQEVIPGLRDQGSGIIAAEWTASEVGDHRIEIKYHGLQIQNSPATARAWDASRVVVSGIKPGRISKPYYFNIDASRAGAGNLEIIISVAGENVPNFVKAEGNAKFEVSCTPQVPDTHMISVKFNGDAVPGSPFYASIVDGSKVTAQGDCLRLVPVNTPSFFTVSTNGVGDAALDVDITAPSGAIVPRNVHGTPADGFKVEYQPNEVGRHKISVRYADVEISGSPFFPEAYDTSLVRVGRIPDGIVNQPVHFDVDCSNAGEGTLTVDVRGQQTTAFTEIKPKGNNFFDVAFTPRENCPHQIHITFNQQKVPGSPFTANLFDTSSISADWQSVRTVPVHKSAAFVVTHSGLQSSGLKVEIQNPQGISVPATLTPMDRDHTCVEFTPTEVGGHLITLQYNTQSVVGSPFTAYTYDAARVKIVDVDRVGSVGREMGFTVDTSEAGQGDIDAEVSCNGQLVRTNRSKIDGSHHRYTFVPQVNDDHTVNVTFNYDPVPGCPMIMKVSDPSGMLMMSGDSMTRGVVEQPAYGIMQTQGAVIDVSQVQTKVTAPNGELVPAKIVQQPDGDYKVEYSSKYTGRHTVEILYAGQAIMGSPFYVEIYDPNKIRVEGVKSGMIGETIGFDIVRNEAGKAELGLTITSPSGRNVPYEIGPTHKGEHVTYVPQEAGPHHIYITYGGLEVPGCPLTQSIQDASTATARGDGLLKGEEDKTSTFFVDTQGKRGDLNVTVEGPNSVAKVMTEIDHSGRYVVSYIPVEVGVYNVIILWNGREIPGSPFHPKVVHAGKVRILDGIDGNNQMQLEVNQIKRIELDCLAAGPGQLTAEVRGPAGTVPCEIDHRGNGRYLVSFMPRVPGEHYLSVWWADVPLPRSPFTGIAGGGAAPAPAPLMTTAPNHEKVILTGRGLQEARVNQEAEFVIDGTDAGPGVPDVKLTGVKADIQVHTQSLGDNKYRCVYQPTIAGAYLLNIMWSDRQVRGSPFKVNVVAASDASKVVCTGEGLKVGIMGKEIKSVIDTRRAGPGELTAHCMGPHKVAYCELYDHRDGTFTLNVKPQEAGRHVLQIKYGGEHVPGSPFVLKISGAPDASKVRVSGPGIEHGILAMFQSRFIVETRGAGAGQLTVRIRGPKGAFRVEMQRESQKDRTILCRYDPTEVGDYIVHIKWSGDHVPGSPFHVQIFDTQDELERFMAENPERRTNTMLTNKSWNADI